jgi:hypothetical protein
MAPSLPAFQLGEQPVLGHRHQAHGEKLVPPRKVGAVKHRSKGNINDI